jgi:hypothetical protein
VFNIVDNLGNIGEADNLESAATAVRTLFEDNPGTCTTIMVTKATEQQEMKDAFDDIVTSANAYMGWGS